MFGEYATQAFQSTLPVWGATQVLDKPIDYPVFQSTLPVWGATNRNEAQLNVEFISIHAPRVGSDCELISLHFGSLNFNPRSPCGERPIAAIFSCLL